MLSDRIFGKREFYLGDLFAEAAQRFPDNAVVLDHEMDFVAAQGTSFTVAELARYVDALAGSLWAAQVRPSEYVLVYREPNFDTALLVCAAARIGAVPVAVSPSLPATTVAAMANRVDRPWLVTDSQSLLKSFASRPQTFAGALTTPDVAATDLSQPITAYSGATLPRAVYLDRREPALITHSSGTTGLPKLSVHTAESLWYRIMPQRAMAWPVRGKERAALCMSFVHSRFYHSLAVFLHHGNPLVVARNADPRNCASIFAATRPGIVETPPNNLILWEELADHPDRPLSSVRYFSSTFDAIHPRTVKRMLAASDRAKPRVVQLYGQSETGPITVAVHSGAEGAHSRCVGLPLPGFVRLRVVDEYDRRVGPGVVGAIQVRTNGRIQTYLGEEGRYQANLRNGWWAMGDIGYRDRRGLVYLVDREIDQVDSVASSLAIEDTVLERLEELTELAIVRSASGTPVPIVCTRDDAPLDRTRWRRAVSDQAGMEEPLHWRYADVPRTATSKIRRKAVLEMVARDEHLPYLVAVADATTNIEVSDHA